MQSVPGLGCPQLTEGGCVGVGRTPRPSCPPWPATGEPRVPHGDPAQDDPQLVCAQTGLQPPGQHQVSACCCPPTAQGSLLTRPAERSRRVPRVRHSWDAVSRSRVPGRQSRLHAQARIATTAHPGKQWLAAQVLDWSQLPTKGWAAGSERRSPLGWNEGMEESSFLPFSFSLA